MELNPSRFGQLLDQADEAMLLISYPDGRIVDANLGAEQLYGYARAQLVQLKITDLRSSGTRADIHRQMDIAQKHGMRFATVHRDSQQQPLPVVVRSSRVTIAGQPFLLSMISRNSAQGLAPLTTHHLPTDSRPPTLHQRHVGELVSCFDLISQHATSGMLLVDQAGHILRVNNALCAFLGYDDAQLVGRPFLFFTLPEDVPVSADLFSAMMAGAVRSYEAEKRYVTSAGRIIWVRVTASALFDSTGEDLLALAQVENITEERRHRDELHHYEALVRYADVAIYSSTLDGTIGSWNPAAERTFGYSEAEIKGRSVTLLLPDGELSNLPYLAQLAGGMPQQLETVRRRKDGSLISVALSLSPIRDEQGRVVGVSSLARDITLQKQLQSEIAQLDRLNIVGEIAASIGHEVRNPMTTVRGYLQLMRRRPEFGPLQPQMALMIEELDRVNGIISEFLSFARAKPAEMSLHDLNQVVSTLLPLMEAEALLKGNDILAQLESIPRLRIDPKEIRQLLLNLVRNGLEAMDAGGRLTISTCRDGDRAVLRVADQGSGIPEDHLSKLGTAFFTTKATGTGLGLPTCFSIAAKHRAKITIETGTEGTTFLVWFEIPTEDQ